MACTHSTTERPASSLNTAPEGRRPVLGRASEAVRASKNELLDRIVERIPEPPGWTRCHTDWSGRRLEFGISVASLARRLETKAWISDLPGKIKTGERP